MPTYEYLCTECGEPLEAVQSFTDEALTVCPACGGRLRKVFSAVGVVFKGSGFYRNDSRSENGKKGKTAAAASSDSTSSDGKSAESKPSESKPSTSSDSAPSTGSSGSSTNGSASGSGRTPGAPAASGSKPSSSTGPASS